LRETGRCHDRVTGSPFASRPRTSCRPAAGSVRGDEIYPRGAAGPAAAAAAGP
jgi:hypothetical protein